MINDFYVEYAGTWTANRASDGLSSKPAYSAIGGWAYYNSLVTDERVDNTTLNRFNWGLDFDQDGLWGAWAGSNLYGKVGLVSKITKVLGAIDKLEGVDPVQKASKIAEAKCLRGWALFMLNDWFGPVNIFLNPDSVSVKLTNTPRPSQAVFDGYIVNDLTQALPDLPDKTNNTPEWGRVNKGVARMLLAKFYMNQHKWAEAKPYVDDILSMDYTLQPDYKSIFVESQNNEIIWTKEANESANGYNTNFNLSLPGREYKILICGVTIQPYVGFENFYMPWDFVDKFTNGDKRLDNIATSFIELNEDGTVHDTITRSKLPYGAYWMKCRVKDATDEMTSPLYTHPWRLADVLLMAAEIESEIDGGPSADIVNNYIIPITDRAGTTANIPANVTNASCTLQEFRDFLCDERGRELFEEGWRRMDLIRIQ
ncbi:MAG TPA: RagB/SusD family nutrient uptake outer membrane protein, partial [Methylococcales bacterium]